jgi:hypothetical protein
MLNQKFRNFTRCAGMTTGLRLAVLALIVLATLTLTGCPQDPPASSPLEGTWVSTSDWGTDTYTIDSDITSLKYTYVSKPAPNSATDSNYTCDIKKVIEFDDDTGVMIVKYASGTVYGAPVDTTIYTGQYYTDLTEDSVKMATAYSASGDYTFTTQAAAEAAFTLANVDTYFGMTGTYTKQ